MLDLENQKLVNGYPKASLLTEVNTSLIFTHFLISLLVSKFVENQVLKLFHHRFVSPNRQHIQLPLISSTKTERQRERSVFVRRGILPTLSLYLSLILGTHDDLIMPNDQGHQINDAGEEIERKMTLFSKACFSLEGFAAEDRALLEESVAGLEKNSARKVVGLLGLHDNNNTSKNESEIHEGPERFHRLRHWFRAKKREVKKKV